MNDQSNKKNKYRIAVVTVLTFIYLVGALLAVFFVFNGKNRNVNAFVDEDVNFYSDTYDILVGKSKKVTFYAEFSEKSVPKKEKVILYADDEEVGELLDNGESPDKKANDGIFTASFSLKEKKAKTINYRVKTKKVTAAPFKICFYKKLTNKDFDNFDKVISRKIKKFETKEEVTDFLTSKKIRDSIRSVTENDDSVIYETVYGIRGVWVEEGYFSNDTKKVSLKNKDNALSQSPSGSSYRELTEKLSASYAKSALKKDNVAVIRPFRESQFQYDDFLTVGEMIADETGGKARKYDEKKATLSTFSKLDEFGVVLVDSHGYLDEKNNEVYICLSQNYQNAGSKYSADFAAGNIIVMSDGSILINSRFIDKHYQKNSLKGSLFFLGSCYSMYNNSWANSLIKKGASVVFGYSDVVSVGYCNKTLVETLVENMLLDNRASSQAYQDTVKICSRTDPNHQDTEFLMMGSKEVRFCKDNYEVTGMVRSPKTGNPFFGVTVKATDENGSDADRSAIIASTKTDRNGRFSIKLPNGEYSLIFSEDGYEEVRITVTINGKNIATDEVSLKKVQSDKLQYEMKEVNIETRTSSGVLYCNSKITYPYFTGSQKVVKILNERYADIIDEFKTKYTNDVDDYYESLLEWGGLSALPYTDDYEVNVKYSKNGYISMLETNHYFTGGAHMSHDAKGFTYNINTGEEMEARDFFEGSDSDVNEFLNDCYTKSEAPLVAEVYDGWWKNAVFVLSEAGACFFVSVGDAVDSAEVIIPYTSNSSPIISVGHAGTQNESTSFEKLTDEKAEELWKEANDVYCTWTYWREDKSRGYSDKGYADTTTSIEQPSYFYENTMDTFYRIRHDEIDSVEELNRYIERYFDEKICSDITCSYIDYDGHLYCQMLEIGGDFSEPAGVTVKSQNGNQATILIRSKDLLYEDQIRNGNEAGSEYGEVEQTMEYKDGRWIFTNLFVYDY